MTILVEARASDYRLRVVICGFCPLELKVSLALSLSKLDHFARVLEGAHSIVVEMTCAVYPNKTGEFVNKYII